MALCRVIPRWIIEITDHLKTQEMCIEAVRIEPVSLVCVPDRFKTQEICDEAVRGNHFHWHVSLIALKPKNCLMKQ